MAVNRLNVNKLWRFSVAMFPWQRLLANTNRSRYPETLREQILDIFERADKISWHQILHNFYNYCSINSDILSESPCICYPVIIRSVYYTIFPRCSYFLFCLCLYSFCLCTYSFISGICTIPLSLGSADSGWGDYSPTAWGLMP